MLYDGKVAITASFCPCKGKVCDRILIGIANPDIREFRDEEDRLVGDLVATINLSPSELQDFVNDIRKLMASRGQTII